MVSALAFFFSSQRIRAPAISDLGFRERLEVAPFDFGAPAISDHGIRERPEVSPFDFDSPNANHIDVDLTTVDPAHQILDYGTLPLSTMDSNGTILPTSSHCSSTETLSQVSGIPTKGNPLLPSSPGEPNQDEHGRLHPFSDVEYLASLPCSVLKELSKNVAEALAAAKQAKKKPVESGGENSLQVHGKRAARSTASDASIISDVLRCKHPGCTTTFRHNKDRLRHFRHKHESNTKTFACPVVDCLSGFGHTFPRSDNLRHHLRAEKTLNLIHWSCVLPGCSEILEGRAGLIYHLGQHDYDTRKSNQKLLMDYGFASDSYSNYLWAENVCSIPGCPFGTHHKDAMDAHLLIHHDGPFCPCPIPGCPKVSQDHDSASTHLAREHDYNARCRFWLEISNQCLRSSDEIFLCPICHKEVKRARGAKYRARLHCQKHDYQELLRFSEALTQSWTFSFGSITHGPERLTITGDMILPYIILPDEEMERLCTKADFEQALAKIGAAIEHSKYAPLS
jgi:Rieske Fe-S protein